MIIAKGKIRHNGVVFDADDEIIDIEEKDAKRLVDLGVAFFMHQETPIQNIKLDKKELLDNAFNATELKEAAREVGLEFPGNISKAKLIELIISTEKADEVLSVEFEEYEEDEE
jgi:hypothetical protein